MKRIWHRTIAWAWERPLYEALVAKGLNPLCIDSGHNLWWDSIDVEADGESTARTPELTPKETAGWRT